MSDYKKILKFYKLSIPKKSKNIKKKADKIIANKFCSCIKKVQQKFKKEGIAIGICTKSVITRKGYKRGSFKCKKRRTINLHKGGKRKKKTRKKRGGEYYDDEGYLVMYEKDQLFGDYGEQLQKQKYKIHVDGKEKWMTWEEYVAEKIKIDKINLELQECQQKPMMNTISEEDDISPECIAIYPITGKRFVRFKDVKYGGKKKRNTRKKRGGEYSRLAKKLLKNKTRRKIKKTEPQVRKIQEAYKDYKQRKIENERFTDQDWKKLKDTYINQQEFWGENSDEDDY